jgi:uncharacterized membrane protein required for colicin V production
MHWVDILVVIILAFSFFGGLKKGAVKKFFELIITLIAIGVAGRFYNITAGFLSFLPGQDWENFIGFLITMGITAAILHIIVLVPGKLIAQVWHGGPLFRLAGSGMALLNTAIGFTLLTLLLNTYPIIDWLVENVAESGILMWLLDSFTFVQMMLPQVFQQSTSII